MKLSDIDWGNDSAEKDPNLVEYFISSSSFQRLAELRKSIVIWGVKAQEKSALMKMLYNHFFHEKDVHVVKITPKFNTIRTILNDNELQKKFW